MRISKTLIEHNDNFKDCPFCSKREWGAGEGFHDTNCPVALAYRAVVRLDNYEKNLKSTKNK